MRCANFFCLTVYVLLLGCDASKPAGDVAAVVGKTLNQTEVFLEHLGEVSLFVGYDDQGSLWLSGPTATGQRQFQTLDELSLALSEIDNKGQASVLQSLGAIEGGLMGTIPPPNYPLEKEIRQRLRENGFLISEDAGPQR